jgi:hypothetical protein
MNVSGKGVGMGVGVGVGVGVGEGEGAGLGLGSGAVGIGPGHPAESSMNAPTAKTRIQERESIPMDTAISRTRRSQSTQYRSR